MKEYDASGTCTAQYIYAGVNKLASVKNNKLYFYHHDRLGSVIAVTDEEGQLDWQGEYFAYGTLKSESGNGDAWKFTGQEFDTESGFYNFKARYYDVDFEHFLTLDPSMEGLSHYMYVHGKPSMLTDPTGLSVGGGGSDWFLDNPGEDIFGKSEYIWPWTGKINYNTSTTSPYKVWREMIGTWNAINPGRYAIYALENVNGTGDYNAIYYIVDTKTGEIIDKFLGSTVPDDPSSQGTIESGGYEYTSEMRMYESGRENLQLKLTDNGSGQISAEGGINMAHQDRSYLLGVWVHKGNWNPITIENRGGRGSRGCPLIPSVNWKNFISYFPKGSSGNIYILRTAGYYWIYAR